MSRFTLAIDPGAHTGLALYCEEQYVASATTDGSSFLSLRDAIGKLIEPHGFMANKVAAVEAGYLGFNPKTGLLLERRRGFCVAAAETHGFSTLDIYPIPGSLRPCAIWENAEQVRATLSEWS